MACGLKLRLLWKDWVLMKRRDFGFVVSDVLTCLAPLTIFMSGCKVSNKPTEISGICWSKETNICVAGLAQWTYPSECGSRPTTHFVKVLSFRLCSLLHSLICFWLPSLIMCTEPEDLRRRAGWDGASGTSRHQLLDALHGKILVLSSGSMTYNSNYRVHSIRCHDSTTTLCCSSSSSTRTTTAAMYIPQSTSWCTVFPLFWPPLY